MPKATINVERAGKCLTYIQASRTAHSFKDLEKHLPQVASISGIQVKDYLQHLSDDNKVRVEKIGSGNWYWSFPSEAAKTAQTTLETTRAAHDKQASTVQDLKNKVFSIRRSSSQSDDTDCPDHKYSREDLMALQAELSGSLIVLERQLAAYRDSDPTELEKCRERVRGFRELAERATDDCLAMEGWFRGCGVEGEGLVELKVGLYEGEYDEEEGGLREI